MVIERLFLDAIEKFLAETKMPPTTFGDAAVSDPNLVFEVRNGRSCSLRLVERVYRFMEDERARREDGPSTGEAA